MKITYVASNGFYDIGYSQSQNRIYLTLQGNWMKPDQVPNWLQDVRAATQGISPGFTLWYDVTRLKASLVLDLWVQAHSVLMSAGLKKAAEIQEKKGSIAAKAQVEAADADSGMPVNRFFDRLEAEAWLDR